MTEQTDASAEMLDAETMDAEAEPENVNYVHVTITYRVDEDDEADDFEVAATWALPGSGPEDKAAWIVSDSGRIEAGEGDYEFAYREVIAFRWMTTAELDQFRSQWGIDPDDADLALGFLGDLGDGVPRLYDDERHSMDGMDWNVGGWTPVWCVDVSIIGPDARPA